MTEIALVRRRTLASDGMGGNSETWATAATIACRISPVTGRDQALLGGRTLENAVMRVTVPALTDVRLADRVHVGSRQFEVLAVAGHSWETARVVVCEERA